MSKEKILLVKIDFMRRFYSIRDMSKLSRFSVNTVSKYVKLLCEDGLLKDYSDGGRSCLIAITDKGLETKRAILDRQGCY